MVSEHASPLAAVGGRDAGGQNVHVAALARHLASRPGVEQVVVHTRRDASTLARRVRLADGVLVDHVDAGPSSTVPRDELLPHMAAFADELAAAWLLDRPDVVHAHFWMSALAALEAAAPLRIPVAVTFHALGAEKRRHQGREDTSPPERVELEADIAERADLVVATSRAEIDELARMGAVARALQVIPCGVDLETFSPEGPRLARHRRRDRIVVVGRLVPRKGVDDVISALRLLPDAELFIAGGPDPARLLEDPDARRLLAWAELEGVAARTTLLGRVEHARLGSLLRSADVVVCVPWYEPFGIVPLEAMACGVPVVASAVGGLLDTVIDGRTGIHVPPRDPVRIADAVRTVLSQPGLARRLGQAGARRARSYTWAEIARATLSAYEELIDATVATRRAS